MSDSNNKSEEEQKQVPIEPPQQDDTGIDKKSQKSQAPTSSRIRYIRQASLPTRDSKAPPLDHRWLHRGRLGSPEVAAAALAVSGGQASGSGKEKESEAAAASEEAAANAATKKSSSLKWVALSDQDNEDCEAAYRAWKASQSYQDEGEQPSSANSATTPKRRRAGRGELWDPTQPVPPYICPIGEDHLWEADFRDMRVYPAFWPGPAVDLVRATWFEDSPTSLKPVAAAQAAELEEHYNKMQPFTPSYASELQLALKLGAEAESKIACALSTKGGYGGKVLFLGPFLARIYTEGIGNRLARSIMTAVSGEPGGGTLVVRGYGAAFKMMQRGNYESHNTTAGLRKKKGRSGSSSAAHSRVASLSTKAITEEEAAPRTSTDSTDIPDGAPEIGSTERKAVLSSPSGSKKAKSSPYQLMQQATKSFLESAAARRATAAARAGASSIREGSAAEAEAATVNAFAAATSAATGGSTSSASTPDSAGQTTSGSAGTLISRLRTIATNAAAAAREADAVVAAEGTSSSPRRSVESTRPEDIVRGALDARNEELEETEEPTLSDTELEPAPHADEQPLELFFVLHGIGQGLVVEHSMEKWSFATA